MSEFAIAAIWCFGQVTVLLSAGYLAAITMRRVHLRSGVWIGNGAIAFALVATLILLAPLGRRHETNATGELSGATPASDAAGLSTSSGHGIQPVIAFTLDDLRARINPLTQIVSKSGQSVRQTSWIWLAIAGVLGCITLIRLVGAVRFLRVLHRSCVTIEDPSTTALLQGIASCLNFKADVRLAESRLTGGAAACGWWNYTIILPIGWRDWNTDEVRAVLAHELAHLRARDCWWRIACAALQLVHAYHPLVYVLNRELRLMQELQADEVAIQAIGSRRDYLRSLARLALWQDSQAADDSAASLLPVFSGYLIRRITMLKSENDVQASAWKRCVCTMTGVMLVSAGVSVLGLRAFAQPPEKDQAPRVARALKSDLSRPPVAKVNDVSLLGDNKHGLCIIRWPEIQNDTLLKEMFSGEELLSQPKTNEERKKWKQVTGSEQFVDLASGEIEYVAIQPVLTIRSRTKPEPKPGDHIHQIAFGASFLMLKYKREMNLDRWIKKYMPIAKKVERGGVSYYQLPRLDPLGIAPMCLAQLPADRTKVLIGICSLRRDDEDKLVPVEPVALIKYLSGAEPTAKSRWSHDWERVSGGTISVVFSNAEVHELHDDGRPLTALASKFLKGVKTYGLRVNAPAETEHFSMRLSFGCDNRESAENAKPLIKMQLANLRKQIRDEYAGATRTADERQFAKELMRMVAESQAVITTAGGGRFNLTIDLAGKLPQDKRLAVATIFLSGPSSSE